MEIKRETLLKITLAAGGVAVLYWGLNNLGFLGTVLNTLLGILSPFLLGLGIAFILSVPMRGFEKLLFRASGKGRRRWLEKLRGPVCLVLSILTVLLIIGAVLFLVLPELGRTAIAIRDSIPGFWEQVQSWSGDLLERYPEITSTLEKMDWQGIWEDVLAFLRSGAGSFLGSTVDVIGSVFNGATTFFLAMILACYVLLQRETLSRQFRRLFYAHFKEERVDRLLSVLALANRTFTRFITGQCVEAVILGTMFFLTMSLFRFPYALMISVLIAFLALIPVFGAFIGCFAGAILILVSDPVKALWFVLLFVILQQIEGNLIYPRVVGSSIGLPGLWVLVAVTIGGGILGIVGMLIMVPLASVIYALVRENTARRLEGKESLQEKCR